MSSRLLASASTLALVFAAGAIAPSSALAECTATAGTAQNPAPGATITCTEPLETQPTVGPNTAGVTVQTSGPSSGYSVTGDTAVLLGESTTVDVRDGGQIATSGDDALGVSAGALSSVTTQGTGRITTQGERAPGVRLGDGSSVTIGGLVATNGSNSNAVDVGANSTVTVQNGGTVRTSSGQSDGIFSDGTNVTVDVNQGGLVTTSSSDSNPIAITGSDATVNVSGEVRSSAGNSDAISLTGANSSVTVTGTGDVSASSSSSDLISATGDNSTIDIQAGGPILAAGSGGGQAVARVGDGGTVTVNREIRASSSNSNGVAAANDADITLEPQGSIVASSSQTAGIRLDSTQASSVNTVTIQEGAAIDASGGQAIVASGPGQEDIQINGDVTGQNGAAVTELGGGDDELTVSSTGTLATGGGAGVLVNGGMGFDTVNLANPSSYDAARFVNVEQINSTGGGNTVNAGQGTQPGTNFGASNGGTVNVNSGAQAGQVTAGSGGTVNVNSGGSANVSADSGQGGAINTAAGSNINVQGQASGNPQNQTVAGATFGAGTNVTVANSAFLSGRAAGDRIDIGLDAGAFSARAGTQNQRAVAGTLDTFIGSPDGTREDQILDRIVLATEPGRLLDDLAAQIYPTTIQSGIFTQRLFSESLRERARLISPTLSAGMPAAPVSVLGYSGEPQKSLPGITLAADMPNMTFEPVPVVEDYGVGLGGFAGVFGGWVDADATEVGTGYDADTYGGMIGLEGSLARFGFGSGVGGIALGYSQTDVELGDVRAESEIDSYHVGLYGGGNYRGLNLAAAIAYAYQDVEVERAIGLPEGDVFTSAEFDGHLVSGSLSASYNFATLFSDRLVLAPTATFDAIYADYDGNEETGDAFFAVVTDDEDYTQYIAGVGVTLGYNVPVGSTIIRPEVQVMYERIFGDEEIVQTIAFAGTDTPFAVAAPAQEEDRIRVGVGLGYSLTDTISTHVRYDGSFADDIDSHRASASVSFRF